MLLHLVVVLPTLKIGVTHDILQASISGLGEGDVVARAVVNTLIGCCTSDTVVLFVNKMLPGGKWSIVKLIMAALQVLRCSEYSRGSLCVRGVMVTTPGLLLLYLLCLGLSM